MARWTVHIWEDPNLKWCWQQWSEIGDRYARGQWGGYANPGLCKAAAKRSINPVYGSKTNPKDFKFVILDAPPRRAG